MSGGDDFHEEKAVGKVYDLALFRRLLKYVKPYRSMASGASVLILIVSSLRLIDPLLSAVALDLFIRPNEGKTAGLSHTVAAWLASAGLNPDPLAGIALLATIYVIVVVLTFLFSYAQLYLMQLMGQVVLFDLRREVFDRLQGLSISYFDKNPIGRLMTRATTDITALNELFSAALVSIFGDLFMLLGIATVMLLLDWRLAVVSLVILPLLYALTRWFKAGARRSYRNVRTRVARVGAFLQEHITGMSLVQLMGREESLHGSFAEINDGQRKAHIQAIFYYGVYFPMVELINALGIALVVWYGGGQVVRGGLTFGELVAFLQYVQRFYRPLAALSEKYNTVQAAMASSERIFELLDTPTEIVSPENGHRPSDIQGRIDLDHVDFAYLKNELVLRDVTFSIEPGETIAVVGHTGAGKSTLANLLLRFYDASSGSVKIDHVDVRDWDLETLRGSIAIVLQDVFLFTGDVASNIGLGDVSPERMRWAAKEVQALEFIEGLPQGFATELRERGAGLSVGQKQLISFARALAADPRILILDEATASIDTETEQQIQAALDRLLVDRTSLVIAHRLSTIRRADRILVLHKGQVRELGTHEELLAARGIYYRLYQLQYREQQSLGAA